MEGYKENVSDHVPDHSYVEWNLQRHLIAANHSIVGLHLADHGCQLQKLLKHFKLPISQFYLPPNIPLLHAMKRICQHIFVYSDFFLIL
jgi:hypothetical protein